jgi:hypothetical protein
MTWTKTLANNYHQQDTNYYCGAAVAQTILESIGAGIQDQNVLYNSNHSHNTYSSWYSDPTGLTYTLNFYKPLPPTFNNYFVSFIKDTEAEGSKKIVYTLWHYGVSTATLVYQGDHWITVRGVSTDVEPVAGITYTIKGFYINNPLPETPSFSDPSVAPPPPHSTTDGCGSGGNRGRRDEYDTYDEWKLTYFTACKYSGIWHNKYVSVCDPEVPRDRKLNVDREEFWAQGDRIISIEEAGRFALKGIDYHNLLEEETFANALHGANPAKPVLVHQLNLPDTFYYLVPMERNGVITGLVKVDGLYGNFRAAQVVTEKTKALFIDRDEVIQKVLNRPIDLGKNLGRITIREGTFCFHPIMVWRPCLESRSPFYPFYMITVGNKNIYIGYDGTIYPELHDLLPGS